MLKLIGVVGTSVGTVGVASGNQQSVASEFQRVTSEYAALDARRQAFASNAAPVLEELSERSLIDSASAEEFPLERYSESRTRLDPSDSADGTAVTVTQTDDEGLTPLLMAKESTSEHTVRLFVKPESGESYPWSTPRTTANASPSIRPWTDRRN